MIKNTKKKQVQNETIDKLVRIKRTCDERYGKSSKIILSLVDREKCSQKDLMKPFGITK